MLKEIHKYNGLIYGWVFRDDKMETLELFNCSTPQDMYEKVLRELPIDGLITEFPGIA